MFGFDLFTDTDRWIFKFRLTKDILVLAGAA